MSRCHVPRLELTWLWWPWGWYGTPSGDLKWTRHGTGLPVSSSRMVTCTQFLPDSTSSTRMRGVSTAPLSTTSPQLAVSTVSPPCFTSTVADGTALIST